MENLVERTDFVSVPVQNMERAKTFYRDTLGLQSPNWEAGFPEIETGNLSLYLVDHIKDGKLNYVDNMVGELVQTITSDETIPTGPVVVSATFT